MRILIIEDEPEIAEYIEDICQALIGDKIKSIRSIHTFDQAMIYLSEHTIDLCLLDLNLNGQNGFDILKKTVSGSFHTIIISAYTDQAIHAFEYGVLDFVPKPFDEERLQAAFNRYFDLRYRCELSTQFLSIKNGQMVKLLHIKGVSYFKAADNYVQIFLKNNETELLDKPLYRLLQILPQNFQKIHRSYVVDINQIKSFDYFKNTGYQVELTNSTVLPLSRQKYKELKLLLDY